jgi:aspartyl-tRNA(Asn)/glutamyl-tRNA(Gln) amidotransferase subunit A
VSDTIRHDGASCHRQASRPLQSRQVLTAVWRGSGRSLLGSTVAAFVRREVSAEELVAEAVRRISTASDLGAVVGIRPDVALKEARSHDIRASRGEDLGPLAGLPFLVKDIEDANGFQTTFGSLVYADVPAAKRDGVAAARLRRSGAILLGKTNTSELALFGHTSNRLFGPTFNPWNRAFSPGGSSGGSAAAIAAGLTSVATATDLGGSIRIPAALCGLAGLKPSSGRIGRDPILSTPDMNHMGPLGATIEDLRLLLGVLVGPVPGDPFSLPHAAVGPDRLPTRVLAATRFASAGPLAAAVDAPFRAALRAVERDLGLLVEWIEPEGILPSGYDPEDWERVVAAEQAAALGPEWIAREAGRLDPETVKFLNRGLQITFESYAGARRRRYRYARELDELLGEDAVLLTPVLTLEGWAPDGRLFEEAALPPWWAFNTEVANFTGHPAASVPAGHGPHGVPFGLQIIGPRFADEMVLGFAAAWEISQPWPLAADGYEPFGIAADP